MSSNNLLVDQSSAQSRWTESGSQFDMYSHRQSVDKQRNIEFTDSHDE